MAAETRDDCLWAVTQLRDLVQTLIISNAMVFVTDKEVALMDAIKRIFRAAYNLLCIWRTNKNVLTNLRAVCYI